MHVVCEGDKRELRSLYGKMKRLQERKKPLVENNFYYATRWLGNLVKRLGGSWKEVSCRGVWDDLKFHNEHISFVTETAWQPPFDLLEFVREKYPSLSFYFEAEGDSWDFYLTNDVEGRYFSSRYVVDCEPDLEYFDTIEEACGHLSAFIGTQIAPTWEALEQAVIKWNDSHEDADWPIDAKKIEVLNK